MTLSGQPKGEPKVAKDSDTGRTEPASKPLPLWNFLKSKEGAHPCLACAGIFLGKRGSSVLPGITLVQAR